jgi:hypothetical protein
MLQRENGEREVVMAAMRGQWLLRNPALTLGLLRASRKDIELALDENETWSCTARGPGVEVRCVSGMVWVTVEGDVEDRVLSAGDSFVSARRGRVAMMAFRPSRVRMAGAPD